MYYVQDGIEQCGYYECKECGSRFLDLDMKHNWELLYEAKKYINSSG